MLTIRVCLLGTLEIRCDDQPLPKPPTLKSQSLLAYLIKHRDRALLREQVADLFWGERSERKARQSLSTALWHIRRCLPNAEFVLSQAHSIQFDPRAAVWLDVDEFESLAAQDDPTCLQSAAALYRGDFLEGFYHDWIISERYRLQALLGHVLARLMVAQQSEGRHEAALSTALELLGQDPLREDAHRAAMQAYCQLGQRNLALEQYRRCRDIVEQELDTEPMVETTELYQAILEGRLAVLPRPQREARATPLPGPASPLGHSPLDPLMPVRLLGRERAMSTLGECWKDAVEGRGGLVLVSGEAGVGKTRLLEELANEQRWHGACVLWGRCYEFERILPYQPIAEALRSILPALDPTVIADVPAWILEQVGRLIPETADRHPALQVTPLLRSEQQRARFFDGLARFLVRLSTDWPLLIILDDLHWATTSTLQLIHYVTRYVASHPVLMVGAFRPEAVGHQHPLHTLQHHLRREGLVRLLHLARLSVADVEAMVFEMSGAGKVVLPLARRLYQETEGNPFFVMEIAKALFETGAIRLEAGVWQGRFDESSRGAFPVPAGVSEAILSRARGLDPDAEAVLHLAAVLGREFDFEVLCEVWDRGEEATLQALDTLLRRRLIEEGSGPLGRDYAFTHHKIQEVVYAGLSGRRRQYTHARIGEAMERAHGSQAAVTAGELAFHLQRGGRLETAAEWAARAGDQAAERSALEEAVAHYELALSLARQTRVQPAAESDLLVKRARMHLLAGASERARDDLEQALALASASADSGRQVQILLALSESYFHLNAFDRMVATARDALSLAEAASDQRAIGIALRLEGQGLHLQGDNAVAKERLTQALVWLGDADDREEQGWALLHLGWVCQDALGELEVAHQHLEAARELFRSSGCAEGEIWTIHSLGNLYLYRGDLQAAVERYDRALTAARRIGYGVQDPIELAHLALGYTLLGHHTAARQCAEECLRLSRAQGQRLWELYGVHWLGQIEHELGHLQEAQRLMTESLTLATEVNYQAGIAWLKNQLSVLHRDMGGEKNVQRAVALAEEAYAMARQVGSSRDQMRALSNQGLAYLLLGHLREALSHSEQALLQAAESSPEMFVQELFYNHARILAAAGHRVEADRFLERAYQEVMASAGRIRDSHLRRCFVENVRLNRRIVAEFESRGTI